MLKQLLKIIALSLLISSSCAYAKPIVVAYLGADSQWQLKPAQLQQLHESLKHVDYADYAFVRFKKDKAGNTLLDVSKADRQNLQSIRSASSTVPIIISIGGWGGRDAFAFVTSPKKRQQFVQSVAESIQALNAQGFKVVGIDVDWENELLASAAEVEGAGSLIVDLRKGLPTQILVTNAVPATPAYWFNYPKTEQWAKAVNWTTIMAYDHYGTFGPTAELGAALYDSHVGKASSPHYPYSVTSGNVAIQHYLSQGLKANQILLGIPFYCHSYYLANNQSLHAQVIDPNLSSQVDYNTAYAHYGDALFAEQESAHEVGKDAVNYFGLIALTNTEVTRFMSCDNPQSIAAKMAYVNGKNPSQSTLAGVSFWSLLQDLPYGHEQSLLKAINSASDSP